MWLGKLQLLSVSILSSENRDYNRLYFVGFCVSKFFTKYISLQNLSGLRQQKFTSCHITLLSVGQLQLSMALFHVSSHSNTQSEGEDTCWTHPFSLLRRNKLKYAIVLQEFAWMGIVTSVYISLAKASHVAKPKVNGMGKLVPEGGDTIHNNREGCRALLLGKEEVHN